MEAQAETSATEARQSAKSATAQQKPQRCKCYRQCCILTAFGCALCLLVIIVTVGITALIGCLCFLVALILAAICGGCALSHRSHRLGEPLRFDDC